MVLIFVGLAIISVGALLFIYNAKAGTITVLGGAVAPVTAGVDNLIGQSNAQWKFTMAIATELTQGKVVQITMPDVSGNPPFSFGSPAILATTTSGVAIGFDPTVAVEPSLVRGL